MGEFTPETFSFLQHAYERFAEAIAGLDAATCDDIYALSFYVFDEDDDPRCPVVALGYNTLTHWKKQAAEIADEQEAKWHLKHWLEARAVVVGNDDEHWGDPLAFEPRRAWLQSLDLLFDEDDDERDPDAVDEKIAETVVRFTVLCGVIGQRLHEQGVIEERFGRTVPILLHESEYYAEIAEETEETNPPGVADEYCAWVRSLPEPEDDEPGEADSAEGAES